MRLAERLPSPEARERRVLLFVERKKDGVPVGEVEWGASALQAHGAFLDAVGAEVLASGGRFLKCAGDGVLALFDEGQVASAINTAIRIQETLEEAGRQGLVASAAVGTGEVVTFLTPGGADDCVGEPVARVALLCATAAPRSVVIAREAVVGGLPAGILSRVGEAQVPPRTLDEYLGPVTAVRLRGRVEAIECHEVLWAGDRRGLVASPPSSAAEEERVEAVEREGIEDTVQTGAVRRWDRDKGQGFILSREGEFFYVDRRYVAGGGHLETGGRVFFVPRAPLIPGRNRVAGCVLGLGQLNEGRVVRVGKRGFGFVEVHDSGGEVQRLFMFLGENRYRIAAGDEITFRVSENERGPVAQNPRRLQNSERSYSPRLRSAVRP